MKPRKVYVASSWRNEKQPVVVTRIREAGHEVYDFRDPRAHFKWSDIDTNWETWTMDEYLKALEHPLAVDGFKADMKALDWANTAVLVLPCGRSAHLELGYAVGEGKETFILLEEMEPELMAKMVDHICLDLDELVPLLATRACDKFKKGQMVEATRQGKEAFGGWIKGETGIVDSFCKSDRHIVIAVDGRGEAEGFHMDYWKPVIQR